MNKFAQKIKEHFNNELVKKANNSFNVSFSNWDKPLFRGVDDRLSKEYGNKTKRSDIINLYSKEESIYEAFLCTMVWGNLGMGRFQYQVDDVFDANKKLSITKKLINVREILKKADPKNNNIDNVISEAFKSMKNKPNHISSVGPAFFTKVLYFIGQTVNWGDMPQPLIYDSIMMRTHEAILKTNYTKQERIVDNSKVSDYLEYIKLMREISDDIGIDPGHLEALLFSPVGRAFVNDILGKKPKDWGKGKLNKRVEKDLLSRYKSFCQKTLGKGKDKFLNVVGDKQLGLRTNIFGKNYEYYSKTAYQSFSIIGFKNTKNKNKIKEALDEEFAKELSKTVDYKEVKDYLVIYNHDSKCETNGKLNEEELINWFNAHAENLVKIINENK